MSQLYWLEPWEPIVMLPGSTSAGGKLLFHVTKADTGPSGSGHTLPERVRERWVSIDRLTENKREDGRDAVRIDRSSDGEQERRRRDVVRTDRVVDRP
ncbi:hypothetical protein DY000_02051567 [Brassica cretica]|uniref:Uncharacterized protein n=1 Tax=Brassica cretica TaxID=69181 RepID=A0ABQ7EZ82_BRACR|nr:hypothetical protein DY000_02051567 [Brassica cretica]